MQNSQEPSGFRERSRDELALMTLELIQRLQRTYEPGKDRVITPENVYQPARLPGRAEMEAFMDHLLRPGSAVEGTENLDHCLEQLQAGRHVLFLAEHLGNFDVPSFSVLLQRSYARAEEIQRRLIYIAGRKLNESSDMMKMFSEKYARLVIVPRRDFPPEKAHPTEAERRAREEFVQYAARINRAAFRQMVRLKRAGQIFVLFPLGGRRKPDADNRPVPETTSYLHSFDTAYLISMEGNTLPPLPRMEDERPTQDRVVYRVGRPLDCKAFLAEEKLRFKVAGQDGTLPADLDYEQYVVEHIMAMLEHLRLHGSYGPPVDP